MSLEIHERRPFHISGILRSLETALRMAHERGLDRRDVLKIWDAIEKEWEADRVNRVMAMDFTDPPPPSKKARIFSKIRLAFSPPIQRNPLKIKGLK